MKIQHTEYQPVAEKKANMRIVDDILLIEKNGIKELYFFIHIDGNILLSHIIKNATLKIDNNNKKINITHDALQLLFSTTLNKSYMKKYIYTFSFSLYPDSFHPSGDFFINDSNVLFEVNLNDIDADLLNKNLKFALIINKMEIIRYYKENDRNKCKFVSLEELTSKKYVSTDSDTD